MKQVWVVEQVLRELVGPVGEVKLNRGQRLLVAIQADENPLQPAKDGAWFAPVVALRRVGAKGKSLQESEQQVFLSFIGIDTGYEALPDAARCQAGLDVLGDLGREVEATVRQVLQARARLASAFDADLHTGKKTSAPATHSAPRSPFPCMESSW